MKQFPKSKYWKSLSALVDAKPNLEIPSNGLGQTRHRQYENFPIEPISDELEGNPATVNIPVDSTQISGNLEDEPLSQPKAIIIHRTNTADAQSVIRSYESGRTLGTEYLVDIDGTIIRTSKAGFSTSHVGKLRERSPRPGRTSSTYRDIHAYELQNFEYPQRYPSNEETIGIEVAGEAVANPNGEMSYPKPNVLQISAVQRLVRYLLDLYDLTYDDVYSHEEVSYRTANEGRGFGFD